MRECRDRADQTGLDARSRAVFEAFLAHIPPSAALAELRADLKRATKDPKRTAAATGALLERHGYRAKSDNKHIRLAPLDSLPGLEPVTLAKTPSDVRGLTNLRTRIERMLGLTKLD